jgi:hypothetical protein
LECLIESVEKKIKGPAQIVVVRDFVSFGNYDTEWLATDLNECIADEKFHLFDERALIFHLESSSLDHFSALIRRKHPITATRSGKPVIPRKTGMFQH